MFLHLSVNYSVHKGGVCLWSVRGLLPPPRADSPPGQKPPTMGRHLLLLGRHPPSQCILGYGQQVGGTHPTEMHACFSEVISLVADIGDALNTLAPLPSTDQTFVDYMQVLGGGLENLQNRFHRQRYGKSWISLFFPYLNSLQLGVRGVLDLLNFGCFVSAGVNISIVNL